MSKIKEMNSKSFLIIIIVAIMSVTVVANTYVSKISLDKERKVEVIVANKDIKENTIITKDMLIFKQKNISEVDLNNIFKNPTDLVGKVAIVPIYENEIITTKRITDFDEKKLNNDFVLKLENNDRNLNIVNGSFIDIWKVPTKKGFELGVLPEIIFSSEYISDLKNESNLSRDEFLLNIEESDVFVPEYLVLNLDETKIKEITNINTDIYSIRISLHKDNSYFENINKLQEEAKLNEKKENDENKEIENNIENGEGLENENN